MITHLLQTYHYKLNHRPSNRIASKLNSMHGEERKSPKGANSSETSLSGCLSNRKTEGCQSSKVCLDSFDKETLVSIKSPLEDNKCITAYSFINQNILSSPRVTNDFNAGPLPHCFYLKSKKNIPNNSDTLFVDPQFNKKIDKNMRPASVNTYFKVAWPNQLHPDNKMRQSTPSTSISKCPIHSK